MKRCAHCGGKFGLVRQRWFNLQFCSRRCLDLYRDKLQQDRDRITRWFSFLARGPA
jgi:hypothetical protein